MTKRQADNLNKYNRVNGNANGITYHRPEGPIELNAPVLPASKPDKTGSSRSSSKREREDSGHRARHSLSITSGGVHRGSLPDQRTPVAAHHRRACSHATGASEWSASSGNETEDDADGDDEVHATELGGFPRLEDLPPGTDLAPLRPLWSSITRHLDQLLKDVRAGNFDDFEIHNMTFWPSVPVHQRVLCRQTAFINLVGQADAAVYDVNQRQTFSGWS